MIDRRMFLLAAAALAVPWLAGRVSIGIVLGVFLAVLNARFHEQEAHIVAQAGRYGAVTIATNMAGRGTDIVLGGNLEKMLASIENDPSLDEATRAAVTDAAAARTQLIGKPQEAFGDLATARRTALWRTRST